MNVTETAILNAIETTWTVADNMDDERNWATIKGMINGIQSLLIYSDNATYEQHADMLRDLWCIALQRETMAWENK